MTFEEWVRSTPMAVSTYANDSKGENYLESVFRSCWDAATFAANTRAGDTSNEAERDARRKVAIIKFSEALKYNSVCTHGEEPDYCDCCRYDWEKRVAALPVVVDAIIREAQGG